MRRNQTKRKTRTRKRKRRGKREKKRTGKINCRKKKARRQIKVGGLLMYLFVVYDLDMVYQYKDMITYPLSWFKVEV